MCMCTLLKDALLISGNMFEEYCALAEYVAEDKSQVSFRSGDKVLVMSKDESGEHITYSITGCSEQLHTSQPDNHSIFASG